MSGRSVDVDIHVYADLTALQRDLLLIITRMNRDHSDAPYNREVRAAVHALHPNPPSRRTCYHHINQLADRDLIQQLPYDNQQCLLPTTTGRRIVPKSRLDDPQLGQIIKETTTVDGESEVVLRD